MILQCFSFWQGGFAKELLREWCMWEKWADFEDLKITNAFLGFMWLVLYCVVSLKHWVLWIFKLISHCGLWEQSANAQPWFVLGGEMTEGDSVPQNSHCVRIRESEPSLESVWTCVYVCGDHCLNLHLSPPEAQSYFIFLCWMYRDPSDSDCVFSWSL